MPEDLKPIELEPYINEYGFLLLRDRESKRPIAWTEDVTVNLKNRDDDDLQVAELRIIVDPRIGAQKGRSVPVSVSVR